VILDLQGFWLNLDRCGERATWMQNRLGELGLSLQYQRVAGVEGDDAEASFRGLKSGEWGAWQGWIRMLNRASQSSAPVVHLMEDDVDISDSFLKLIADDLLFGLIARRQIVCTDAYVSPRQCLALLHAVAEARGDGRQWLQITAGFKIPCLNSLLMAPHVAGRLCAQLQGILNKGGSLRAIDIVMAEVSSSWSTIVPFVTSPKPHLASVGATRRDDESVAALSRDALTLLRRALFCKDDDFDLRIGLADLMAQLAEVGVLRPY